MILGSVRLKLQSIHSFNDHAAEVFEIQGYNDDIVCASDSGGIDDSTSWRIHEILPL